MRGFRIATLFGIPIEINPSWLFIFGLILWSLTSGVFPQTYPGLTTTVYALMGLATTLLFFGSLIAHELSHSLVSQHYGLRVRRIILFVFGGISETTQELPSPKIEFQVAVAGPVMSFVLSGIFALVAWLTGQQAAWGPVSAVATWLSVVNFALGIFNLLPGFPLDGGRLLRAAAWKATGSLRRATRIASRGGQLVGLLMMLWGFWRLSRGDLFGAVWVGAIGYLLFQTAGSTYGELIIQTALGRVGVTELMSRDPKVLAPDMSLQEVVEDYLMRYPYGGYPVVDGHLDGVLQANQIKEVPAAEWPTRRVAEVMTPMTDVEALDAHATVAEAVTRFNQLGVGRLPVVDQGQVVGVLSQSDVVRWLAWHPEAERDG